MFHPGWGKAPERYSQFLFRIADCGFLPIGIDTRYAYSDRKQPRANILAQHWIVGKTNPYHEVNGRAENRWKYRRSTVALDIMQRLNITGASQVGHSEGARIATLVTLATPDTPSLVLINGAGTGDSSRGVRRLVKSNVNRAREMARGNLNVTDLIRSSLGSTAYALTHLRRTVAEKAIIQTPETWDLIDELKDRQTATTVLHAIDDELVSFAGSRDASLSRQWVPFEATPGDHSNIFHPAVQDLAIIALQAPYRL
jgi:pimeloyl-ACP methyl ester carboxylesterase